MPTILLALSKALGKQFDFYTLEVRALRNFSIKEQMEKFLIAAQDEYKSNHVVRKNNRCNMNVKGISLLIRCQTEGVEEQCLVIGSVSLSDSMQSQGWFKSFLNYCIDINPWEKLVIEDVNNLRLREFCRNSGFKPVSNFFSTSFIVDQNFIKNLNVKEFNS